METHNSDSKTLRENVLELIQHSKVLIGPIFNLTIHRQDGSRRILRFESGKCISCLRIPYDRVQFLDNYHLNAYILIHNLAVSDDLDIKLRYCPDDCWHLSVVDKLTEKAVASSFTNKHFMEMFPGIEHGQYRVNLSLEKI